jgi:hypothetical protein
LVGGRLIAQSHRNLINQELYFLFLALDEEVIRLIELILMVSQDGGEARIHILDRVMELSLVALDLLP